MADNDPTPSPAPDPTPDPAPDPTPDPAPDPAADFKPITSQEQFDNMVKERLARQKAQFADYGELKAKAEQFDKLQAEQMSELEKANDRAAKLERELADATSARQDSVLRAAVISEAAKKNVVDPDAAMALLDRATLEFDSDGQPTNIATAMDSLLEQRPYLVAQAGGSRGNADQGARGNSGGKDQLSREALTSMTPEQIQAAQAEGRLDAVLGVTT